MMAALPVNSSYADSSRIRTFETPLCKENDGADEGEELGSPVGGMEGMVDGKDDGASLGAEVGAGVGVPVGTIVIVGFGVKVVG